MRSEGDPVARIGTHYARLFPDGIGVAVSGGSDSLALLHAAHTAGLSVDAVTVDHGLRAGSAAEAARVADLCRGLGVSHSTLQWDSWDGTGNVQNEARHARYALIADWAQGRGLASVALGHTMDDQAETFLMRLAREAGIDGLARMNATFERAGQRFDRPFLPLRRADLQAYLTGLGVGWIDDPSNDDDAFDRVKARRALAALEPLGIGAETLFAVSGAMQDARAALSRLAADFARTRVRSAGGDLIFDRPALRGQPFEIQRRLVGQALRFVASADYPPRRQPLDEVLRHIETGGNTVLHGCRVMVSDMTLRIAREHAAVSALAGPTDALWDGRWRLEGPHAPDLEVRALGAALPDCPGWRDSGLPRASLLASPAVWRGQALIAAPVAGLAEGWRATAPGAADFVAFLISH